MTLPALTDLLQIEVMSLNFLTFCLAIPTFSSNMASIGTVEIREHERPLKTNTFSYVGFEVFTAVVTKSIITNFWDITPRSPLSTLPLAFWFLAELISSTLKMEEICSS
jgi:hypothetical protein